MSPKEPTLKGLGFWAGLEGMRGFGFRIKGFRGLGFKGFGVKLGVQG